MSNCKNSKKKKWNNYWFIPFLKIVYFSCWSHSFYNKVYYTLGFFFYEVLTISVYCLITYWYKQIQPSPETKIKTKVNRRNKQQQKNPPKTKNKTTLKNKKPNACQLVCICLLWIIHVMGWTFLLYNWFYFQVLDP